MTLTCHGFQSYQEADQAGEADPAGAVAVPEGHEIQQLTADRDPCKEVWATGEPVSGEEAGRGGVPALKGLRNWFQGPSDLLPPFPTQPQGPSPPPLWCFDDSLIACFLVVAGP